MCIFNAVKKQSGMGFVVDALFGYFAYLHGLCTVTELHINFVLNTYWKADVFIYLMFYWIMETYNTYICTGTAKYPFSFGKRLKKSTEYFLKFLLLFVSTILPVNNGK